MTARGFYTLLFGALMLFTALSVGSAGAFLLGTAALLWWSFDELIRGVNPFRRGLGAVVLCALGFSLLRAAVG